MLKKLLFSLAFGSFLLTSPVWAACTAFWDRPLTYTDGSPLSASEPLAYRVYIATTSGGYTVKSAETITTTYNLFSIPSLPKTGFVVVTAVLLSDGGESARSNEVPFVCGLPGAPVNLRVQ